MKNLATILAILLLSTPAHAGQGATVEQWKQHFNQTGRTDALKDKVEEAKDAYGKLNAGDTEALKKRLREAKDTALSASERKELWDAWKKEHPDAAEAIAGTDYERQKQWEEWMEAQEHTAAGAALEHKKDLAFEKWQELKAAQSDSGTYMQRGNLEYLKYKNRDEAMELKEKYEDWRANHPDAAESLKEKYRQMRGGE